MRFKAVPAVLVAVTLATGVAACGDDQKPAASSGNASEQTASGAGGIKVEKRTIGIINLVRQSPSEDKIDQLYEKAGEALGWDVKIVDGAGDPQKIARAAQTFVNEGVDALITTSTESAVIRGALRQAKQKDIPTISTNGGTAKSDLFTAQYEEDEVKMGQQLAEHIKESQPDAKIANLQTSLALSAKQRDDAFHATFPKPAFLAEQQVDLTNPVANTEKTLSAMLTAKPDINAVHAVYDNMAQASVTTIKSKRSDAKLYTYFTTAQNVKNLKADTALQAVSDVDSPKTGAVAFDQLLAHFQKDQPIDPDALQKDKLTYNIVSRDNVDDLVGDGTEQYTIDEVLKPYLDKWSKEYSGQ